MKKSDLVIYQASDGKTKIDAFIQDESVWLNQTQMAELFQTTKQNISLHLKNIFEEGELESEATVKEFLTVQKEGSFSPFFDSTFRKIRMVQYFES